MVERPSAKDIKRGLELVKADKNKLLVKCWFREYLNQTEVFDWINHEEFKTHKGSYTQIKKKLQREAKLDGKRKVYTKRGNSNKISEAFRQFQKCGFFDTKIVKQKRTNQKGTTSSWKIKKYRMNLNPYFEHIKQTRKVNLPKEWKKFLEKEMEDHRDPFMLWLDDYGNDLFSYIDYEIKRNILFQRFKRVYSEIQQEGIEENSDFIIALKLALNLFDDLSRSIFVELIRDKLHIIKYDFKDKLTKEQTKKIDWILGKL